MKKIRDHPYNVKRDTIGMRKSQEVKRKYTDLREKRKLTENELKELAENELEFTKYVPSGDVQFIKEVPSCPKERLKRTPAAKFKKMKKDLLLYIPGKG